MTNMLDYLTWRGDLPFTLDPLNEVDALVFAQLTYIRWEYIWQEGEIAFLQSLYSRIKGYKYSTSFTAEHDLKMLPIAKDSVRFGQLPVTDFVQSLDAAAEEQFAAITFHLPDKLVIAFRGTDCTLVGWREDFKLACTPEVAAQRRAAEYLSRLASDYPGIPIILTGHSKGGNLAVYAAATASPEIRMRITDVYNFDGPGQSEKLFTSAEYAEIENRIHTLVPESSIIAMLMCHPSVQTVLKSGNISIYQHDPYYWSITCTHFDTLPERNSDSKYFESVFERWLSEVNMEDRTVFVDTLFDILSSTNAQSFGQDFVKNLREHPMEFLSSFQNVDKASWLKVSRVVGAFLDSAVQNGFAMSPVSRLMESIQARRGKKETA